MSDSKNIVLCNVLKFYGEVFGVNCVDFDIEFGIMSFVGLNGLGKLILMNFVFGLLCLMQGIFEIFGMMLDDLEQFFCYVGYCMQIDSFFKGFIG